MQKGLQNLYFDTVGWAAGRASDWVVAWLSVWSEVQISYGPADATAIHYLLLQ